MCLWDCECIPLLILFQEELIEQVWEIEISKYVWVYLRPDLVSKEIDRALQSEPNAALWKDSTGWVSAGESETGYLEIKKEYKQKYKYKRVQLGESALGKARQVILKYKQKYKCTWNTKRYNKVSQR